MQYLRHNQNFVCYFSEIQMSLSILCFFWQHYPKSSTSFRDFPYSEQQVDIMVLGVESLPAPCLSAKVTRSLVPFLLEVTFCTTVGSWYALVPPILPPFWCVGRLTPRKGHLHALYFIRNI